MSASSLMVYDDDGGSDDIDYYNDDHPLVLFLFLRLLNVVEPGLVTIVRSYIGLPCDNCEFGIVLWDTYIGLELFTVSECNYYNISRDTASPIGCPIHCDDCMDSRCHTGDIYSCNGCYRDACNGCFCGCDCVY